MLHLVQLLSTTKLSNVRKKVAEAVCSIAVAGTQELVQHMVDHGVIEPLCDLLPCKLGLHSQGLFAPKPFGCRNDDDDDNRSVTAALEGLEKILRVRRSLGGGSGADERSSSCVSHGIRRNYYCLAVSRVWFTVTRAPFPIDGVQF